MVQLKPQYPDDNIDTLIFLSLYKFIKMDIQYFPNVPRI